MARQEIAQTKTILSAARESSSESLNVQMSKHSSYNLLAISFSSLPSLDSTHSFTQVPDFPRACSPPLFLTLGRTPTLRCPEGQSLARSSHATISTPTHPRLRIMLVEPISVARWMEQSSMFASASIEDTKDEFPSEDPLVPEWKAEGSLFSPEHLQGSLRRQHTSSNVHQEAYNNSLLVVGQGTEASCDDISDCGLSSSVVDCSANSAISLSGMGCSTDSTHNTIDPSDMFESAPVPTIMLSDSTAAMPLSVDSSLTIATLAIRRGRKKPAPLDLASPVTLGPRDDLYPGIPTPFLGSPSSYSPKFEFSQNATGFSMDLAAMCQDLRNRCPPLHPPSPPRRTPSTPISAVTDSDSSSSTHSSNDDSDDWAFAKTILAEHLAERAPHSSEFSESTVVSQSTSPDSDHEVDSYSWASAPTLTNSPHTDTSSGLVTPPTQDSKVDPTASQRRRRTVIIETPRNNTVQGVRPARITIDLSHLADDSADASVATEFDQSLPLEALDASTMDSFVESTPRHLRPVSNGTLRMPIRGILKRQEKKRVRFSLMPGQDGEGGEDEDDVAQEPKRKRAATTPAIRTGASHRLRSGIPDEFAAQRASFPKHPVVKAFTRHSVSVDVSPTPPSRAARQSMPLVPRVVDKSEVGVPKKLSSSIARRSMSAVDGKRKSVKMSRTDENSGRRHSEEVKMGQKTTSPSKSRMPFRTIFTKLRS